MSKKRNIPAVETKRMALADLAPADYNPRRISPKAMQGLRASLTRFGELGGIVFNRRTGNLVGGHQRVKALLALGETDAEVRVVDLPVSEEKAANLALNHPGIGGEWDEALLRVVLDETARDLPTMFDELQLADLIGEAADPEQFDGNTDPDEAPEPPAIAVSRPGDLWVLGNHRLICGDSTDAATVTRLLAGAKPHLMVTDPPYGVEYDANWRNEAKRADGTPIGAKAVGKVRNDGQSDWRGAWALFPGDVAYVWHAPGALQVSVFESLTATNFDPRYHIVWAKSVHVIGRGNYHWRHEACWYAVRRGAVSRWQGARDQNTVWEIEKPRSSETGHSTQKPVECMLRPMLNNSAKGDSIYEPFSGSGTTIIAGEMTHRHVYAVELAPEYVDVAVRRWQTYTGKAATLDGDGRTFAEIEGERNGPSD